jgi:hypothetical protein
VVIKGGARGDAAGLAAHLLRTDTNEAAAVVELDGMAATDLCDALREMAALAAGTRSTRPLYHASINASPDETLTAAQRATAITELERALGLTGQPRAVVEHMKANRIHWHVVWSRIDLTRMAAISDSHNYRKHEEAARRLEREFGHARVQGAHAERDPPPLPDDGSTPARRKRPTRTPSHAEMQQAERSGITPQDAKDTITALWRSTDSGKAFAAVIGATGWTLARGDKRDFVLIDRAGETHSLARRIDGAKAKDVRERMADLDAASLPTVDEARARQQEPEQPMPQQAEAVAPVKSEPVQASLPKQEPPLPDAESPTAPEEPDRE